MKTSDMKLRRLGAAGRRVSAVGFGSMSFTNFYGSTTDENSAKILDACVDLGITHVDTADAYGNGRAETVIGNWLKGRKGAPPFAIATKAGISQDPKKRIKNDAAYLMECIDASLTRLGVEAVDMFYLHRRDPEIEIEEVTESLASIVKAGKAKAFGFSEIAPSSLRRAQAVHDVGAVQSEYSLSTRAPDLGLVQRSEKSETTFVAFSPVGRGLLTDRPPSAATIQDMPWMKVNPRFTEPNLSANLEYSERFQRLAADFGVPTASLAIAWVLHQGEHILTIPGTRNLSHLRELAFGGKIELSSEELTQIEDVLPVGWAHGDRYSDAQWAAPERYC